TGLCVPAKNATAASVYPDGDEGIDNAWGKTLVPLLTSIQSGLTQTVNDQIAQGKFSLIIQVDGIGASEDYNPLVSRVLHAPSLGAPPKWDGTDQWPIAAEDLNGSDIKSAKFTTVDGYLTKGTWVSGSGLSGLALGFPASGSTLVFPINHAMLSMNLNPDHKGAIGGVIAGVIPTEAFVDALRKVAATLNVSFCSGAQFDAIAD